MTGMPLSGEVVASTNQGSQTTNRKMRAIELQLPSAETILLIANARILAGSRRGSMNRLSILGVIASK